MQDSANCFVINEKQQNDYRAQSGGVLPDKSTQPTASSAKMHTIFGAILQDKDC